MKSGKRVERDSTQITTDLQDSGQQGIDLVAPEEPEGWAVSLRKNSNTLKIKGNSKCAFANAELYCNGRFMASCAPAHGRKFSFGIRNALGALPGHLTLQIKCDGRLVPYAGKQSGWSVSEPFRSDGETILDIEAKLSKGFILSKKGRFVPQSMSDKFKDGCFRLYTALSNFFEAAYEYPVLVTHGTLLGLVREGDLVPFDDDFDCLYLSAMGDVREAARERDRLMRDLANSGFAVQRSSSGHIKVTQHGGAIDLMPAWRSQKGKFCISGYTSMVLPAEAIHPLSWLPFQDGAVRAFARPELFLEHQYGPNWRIPDPGYRSVLSSEAKRNMKVLKREQPD